MSPLVLQASLKEAFFKASGSALLLLFIFSLSQLPALYWELASQPFSLSAREKSCSPSTASQNSALHSAAVRSCLCRSLLHSSVWCELKHWGQGLLDALALAMGCPGRAGVWSLRGESKPRLPDHWESWHFAREIWMAWPISPLTLPQASEELLWGLYSMSPVPPPQRCQQPFVGLALCLDH